MILLFNQYFKDPNIVATIPVNLLSLATYLKTKYMDCKIYELSGLTQVEIKRIILAEKPSIVGIGCQFTPHFPQVLEIADTIKEVDDRINVVIGGNHASSLNYLPPNIDYIIQGEGEQNFYDLCMDLELGYESPRIRKPYPLVSNLDELPILDYSLVDLNRYTSYSSPFFMREPVLGIFTSRGCPNNCIYCTVKGVWGRTWRGKSPRRVVDEIEILKNMGIKEFQIMDDSASVHRERWESICYEIIRRKLDIKWSTPNGIAHWTLEKSTLMLMKLAGCYRITLGIESGNPEIRKFIRKNYPLEQAKEIIDYANKIGMWTISTTILGFPNETREQMYDTLNFVKKSNVDFTTFYLLDTYPTADVSKYKSDLTLACELQPKFYQSFLIHRILHFWNIAYKINSWEDLLYTARLVSSGIKIFLKSFGMKTTKGLLYGKN